MIYADATGLILGSPVISVVIGGIGTGIVSLGLLIWRMLSRLSLLETQIADVGKTLEKIDRDLWMLKWGASPDVRLQQRYPHTPMEGSQE